MIAEVLNKLDDERYIVKASTGPRYVVVARKKVCRNASSYILLTYTREPKAFTVTYHSLCSSMELVFHQAPAFPWT